MIETLQCTNCGLRFTESDLAEVAPSYAGQCPRCRQADCPKAEVENDSPPTPSV